MERNRKAFGPKVLAEIKTVWRAGVYRTWFAALLHGRRRWVAAAIAVVATAGIGVVWRRFLLPPPPLEISFWYWRQPFQLVAADLSELKQMGVRRLFVRAGTFHQEGDSIRLTLPQRWASRADGLTIHLVFNFDASVVHGFAGLRNEALAAAILPEVARARTAAESAGLQVSGVQFDLDCPTSRLPKYADLLHRIRTALPRPYPVFSITALPAWYGNPKLEPVLHEIDFAAPQYYEAKIGHTRDEYTTVAQPANAARGLAAAGWRGAPFFAGIPAYGHALVYNATGRLVGMYHDMGICEAIRSGAFHLEQSFGADEHGRPAKPADYIGEDVYDLRALVNANDGQGKGYHVVYDIPTPISIERHLALLRRKRPGNCQGMILFRYPETGESETVPLRAIAGILRGESVRPNLRVQLRARAVPWEMLESGATPALHPVDVAVVVTNIGKSNTFVAPDAVSVTLALESARLEDISVRGSDSVGTYAHPLGDPSADAPALRSSPGRANVIRLRRLYLAAGETQTLATLRLRTGHAAKLRGVWSVRCPGGFESVTGVVSESAIK